MSEITCPNCGKSRKIEENMNFNLLSLKIDYCDECDTECYVLSSGRRHIVCSPEEITELFEEDFDRSDY